MPKKVLENSKKKLNKTFSKGSPKTPKINTRYSEKEEEKDMQITHNKSKQKEMIINEVSSEEVITFESNAQLNNDKKAYKKMV